MSHPAIPSFVLLSSSGKFIRTSTSSSHVGTRIHVSEVDSIDRAEVFHNVLPDRITAPFDQKFSALGPFTPVAVREVRTVTIIGPYVDPRRLESNQK